MPVSDAPSNSNPAFSRGTPPGNGGAGAGTAEKVGQQIRQQALKLRVQGLTRISGLADTGKGQFASKLADVAEIIESVAEPVEKSYGSTAADYVRSASAKVRSIGDDLHNKSVEELVSASRSAIGNNPAIAIGAAAVLGFAAARIAKGGLGEQSEGDDADAHQAVAGVTA